MEYLKIFKTLVVLVLFIISYKGFAQNSVGIGTENPNPNAVLELTSPTSNQGLLVPRLTTAQRTAAAFVNSLTQSENGLLVYDTNLNTFFYWQNNAWQLVSGLTLTAGENITISPTGVVSAQFTETQNLTLTNNILRITNNPNATDINLTPYLNVQTATQVPVTPNADLVAVNVQSALEELQTEVQATTSGGMVKTVYDPTNINASAFDLANHVGNLPNTRITGLGTAATLNAGTALNNLVQVGPNGLPALGGSLLTGLSLSQFSDIGALATLDEVGTSQITNNTILNEDISPSALITGTKVVPNFGPQNISTSGSVTADEFFGDGSGLTNIVVSDGSITGGTGLGAKIAANTINNDNISATAAISGTKINPNFGAQDIVTTGAFTVSTSKVMLTNPASTDTALSAITYSNQPHGYAISGIQRGTGDAAGYFITDNPNNDFPAVYGETRSTQSQSGGIGVMGSVLDGYYGRSGFFLNNNANNFSPTVEITNNSNGPSLVTSGMVGIGTTNPNQKLHIGGINGEDTYAKIEAGGTGSNFAGLLFSELGFNFGMSMRFDALTDNFLISTQDNGLNFTDLFTVRQDGRVGIGTTSPTHMLDVDGNIRFRGSLIPLGNNGVDDVNMFFVNNVSITSGIKNFGWLGGHAITTGSYNVILGNNAGFDLSTGDGNILMGVNAGGALTAGADNVFIGSDAGVTATGSGNVAIGVGASISAGAANASAIGQGASATANNTMVFGAGIVTGWGFGTQPGAAAIRVGTNGSNGNGATLTTGGTWTNASDKFKKENFKQLDANSILQKVKLLPITRWNYIGESADNTHIGPMAQDFYKLFNTGSDDKTISTIDPSGVALVAIKALLERVEKLEAENNQLRANQRAVQNQTDQINALAAQLNELKLLVRGKGKEQNTVIIDQEK